MFVHGNLANRSLPYPSVSFVSLRTSYSPVVSLVSSEWWMLEEFIIGGFQIGVNGEVSRQVTLNALQETKYDAVRRKTNLTTTIEPQLVVAVFIQDIL